MDLLDGPVQKERAAQLKNVFLFRCEAKVLSFGEDYYMRASPFR
jgi:hypothetical protein